MYSSPARAPKLQLAVGQPLTGGRWNHQKEVPRVQRQEACSEMVGGVQVR